MSLLAQQLAPSLPTGVVIPEPLERAWTWMEAQGWGLESRGSYFLTPYAGTAELGIVFSATETLAGWFEPGEPGADRLVPLGQTDGTGSLAALWLDPSDTVRFVLLGSEGERVYLADDAVAFLQLLAIGYLELRDDVLLEEPDEDEDAEAVEALADLRAWVQDELGVEVPAHWSVRDPDPFDAWVADVKGEARPEESAPSRVSRPFDATDATPAEIVEACEQLVDEPRTDGSIRFGKILDVEVVHAEWGHEVALIVPGPSFDPAEHAPLVADRMETIRAAFRERWGAPRTESAVEGSWAERKRTLYEFEWLDLWELSDDAALALFTSAPEGRQVAGVVARRAIDEAHRY